MTGHVQDLWSGPCGCRHTGARPDRRPWLYRPELHWFGWKTLLPAWLGGDEWCRRTLVVGWNFTGQVVIPLRYCRGCEHCGPEWVDGTWVPV
jgi:hypothetical protein